MPGSPVELAANLERPVHLRGLLADADGQHRAHARLIGAAQHRFAVVGVARAVKVGVRIDQQRGPSVISKRGRTSRLV